MLMYLMFMQDNAHTKFHGLCHRDGMLIWQDSFAKLWADTEYWHSLVEIGSAKVVVYDTEANTLEDVL